MTEDSFIAEKESSEAVPEEGGNSSKQDHEEAVQGSIFKVWLQHCPLVVKEHTSLTEQ